LDTPADYHHGLGPSSSQGGGGHCGGNRLEVWGLLNKDVIVMDWDYQDEDPAQGSARARPTSGFNA
jgi:hypothetical protein